MALRLQLEALAYPHCDAAEVNFNDPMTFKRLVLWLENTKIRHYIQEDRKGLEATTSAHWDQAFQQYLSDLECPLEPSAPGREQQQQLLGWLLAHAVHLEYEGLAEEYNRQAPAASSSPPPSTSGAAGATSDAAARLLQRRKQLADTPLEDLAGAEVQAELTALLAALQPAIDRGASSSSSSNSSAAWTSSSQAAAPLSLRQRLEEAHAVLRDKVLPYASLGAEAWQQAGAGPEAVLAPVPLGFDTGDPGVDVAARLLRVLYIRDLRQLQTQVDSALVQLQELTAIPRTDTSLGRIGS